MDSAPTSARGAEEGKSGSHEVSPPPRELWEPAAFKALPEQSFTVKGIPLYNCNQPVWSRESGQSPSVCQQSEQHGCSSKARHRKMGRQRSSC